MHFSIYTKIEDQRLYLQRIFTAKSGATLATLMGSWEIAIGY